MADFDASLLENIFKMLEPADLLGARKLTVGKRVQVHYIQDLLDLLYGTQGALSIDDLSAALTKLTQGKLDPQGQPLNADTLKEFKRVLHVYKTGAPCEAFGDAPFMALDSDGKTVINKSTFQQIIGKNVDLGTSGPFQKQMGIILSNSSFLSPTVRNADRCEMFLNFAPAIITSRMVPYLEVEFDFNRGVPDVKTSQPHQWSPGIMRFLLGGDNALAGDTSTGTGKMLNLLEVQDPKAKTLHSTMGMEVFTSPQTLVDPSPNTKNSGRYVDVLDPFRPLLSIQSFNVNVTPTVGLYSYKKGTLTMKLHDRSRLSEIADLIRPQVYQDASSAPVVWITYGWRHPAEPGNPYADFVNANMLVREAYGIINSQFAFDNLGQVTVTLSLWTKGMAELRTLNVNDDGTLKIIQDIREIAKKVSQYRSALGIGTMDGVNKEIRGFMLLDAASRGTFPDMSKQEITESLRSLKASLLAPSAKLDTDAAKKLLAELNKLYNPSDKHYLDYKKQLEQQATHRTAQQFEEVLTGVDPFLPSTQKDTKRATESNARPHPLTGLVEALNAYQGEAELKKLSSPLKSKVAGSTPGFRKKAASFGKLVSVFVANAYKNMDDIDEVHLYFYGLNDHAGAAAGVNIAEFPIEMPVFLDQYREHVERKGSERVTLEEFLKIAVDGQLHDPRAIGYGFRQYYAPYDPANKYDAKLARGVKPEELELVQTRSHFQMPAIEMFVETVYASKGAHDIDALHQFESPDIASGGTNVGRTYQYTRIMRIHIFDHANTPYALAGQILRGDGYESFSDIDVPRDDVNQKFKDKKAQASELTKIISNLSANGKLDFQTDGKVSNAKIKEYVSKLVPTIVYGMNASSVVGANLASKQDPLLATVQMQAMAKGAGRKQTLSANGSDVGGLPLRIIPASMTLTTMGCPLLTYGQQFFVDFNTGTTIDNIYALTGLNHTVSPGKFESEMTLTFYDAYGKFFGAPTVTEYVKSMVVPG